MLISALHPANTQQPGQALRDPALTAGWAETSSARDAAALVTSQQTLPSSRQGLAREGQGARPWHPGVGVFSRAAGDLRSQSWQEGHPQRCPPTGQPLAPEGQRVKPRLAPGAQLGICSSGVLADPALPPPSGGRDHGRWAGSVAVMRWRRGSGEGVSPDADGGVWLGGLLASDVPDASSSHGCGEMLGGGGCWVPGWERLGGGCRQLPAPPGSQ